MAKYNIRIKNFNFKGKAEASNELDAAKKALVIEMWGNRPPFNLDEALQSITHITTLGQLADFFFVNEIIVTPAR